MKNNFISAVYDLLPSVYAIVLGSLIGAMFFALKTENQTTLFSFVSISVATLLISQILEYVMVSIRDFLSARSKDESQYITEQNPSDSANGEHLPVV